MHRTAVEKLRAMVAFFNAAIEDLNDQIGTVAEAERCFDAAPGSENPSDAVSAWLFHVNTCDHDAAPPDLTAAFAASFLAQQPGRLATMALGCDPIEQLDDGSLLRVKRTARGFRIEHVTRSGDAPPEQAWEVDAQGRPLR